ncbi:MAG: acyl carrier protein [Deltaproteobacteria bacterium]|nr:acyl carrier protein [Deltaproteobacteria bacterium]
MTETQIKELALRILGEIAPEADLEKLRTDARIRDQMDFDSVDYLNFAMALQEALGIKIPEADLYRLATIDGCIAYLRSKSAPGDT